MILRFPDLATLQLAITSDAIPESITRTPGEFACAGDGSVEITSDEKFPRAVLADLRRLGVTRERDSEAPRDPFSCWAEIFPTVRTPLATPPGETTPVLFDVPAESVAGFVAEILRLGNDRQSFRWIDDGERALLRVIGPPYYALLRAIDRGEDESAPIGFVERAPRVWVELGCSHAMSERLRPAAGVSVFLRAGRRFRSIEDGKFRDIYEAVDFRLPAPAEVAREAEVTRRFQVPLRLSRGGTADAPELWVVRDRAEQTLDELVSHADGRLLARLAFAVVERDGSRTVIVRARPSKGGPPALVLEGESYRSYLRLPNLFLPVGTRLHPPLRRDAIVSLLASDGDRITWLAPTDDGGFIPESVLDESFRPLDAWVDYVLDREHEPLTAWVRASRFDFEPFICNDEAGGDEGPGGPGRKKERKSSKTALQDDNPQASPAPVVAVKRHRSAKNTLAADLDLMPKPGEAVIRLSELEREYIARAETDEADDVRDLWREMATLNASLDRVGDATACWSNAAWEVDEIPREWAESWAGFESRTAGRDLADPKILDRILDEPKPSPPEARVLASSLILAASGHDNPHLAARMTRVVAYLGRVESMIPIRFAWLAWRAVVTVSAGDVLALARARDRLLERLHGAGLSPDLDLPGFLRFSGSASGERIRAVGERLIRLRDASQKWIASAGWGGPYTSGLVDLIYAYGLARLGDSGTSGEYVRGALEQMKKNDPVLSWLGKAFDYRVRQALEGKPALGSLPENLLATLEAMSTVGDEAQREREKQNRYKIDRLREHSRILEPHEKIDPYRHWRSGADATAKELAAIADLVDRDKLADRMTRLLATRDKKDSTPIRDARILGAGLDVGFRLGDRYTRNLLDAVLPTVERLADVTDRAILLEKGIHLAAHFDQPGHVQSYVNRFEGLIHEGGPAGVVKLEPLLGQSFRGLRKLGMRDRVGSLLDVMAHAVLGGKEVFGGGPRKGSGSKNWGQTLRIMLHLAAGWYYFGQPDRALPVLDEVRETLREGDLLPLDQTALACGYIRALGHAPNELALNRLGELFSFLDRIRDSFTTNSHYSLSRLDLVEAVVTTLISEEFTLDTSARRRLDEDEFRVRRRIHRDVRAALGE